MNPIIELYQEDITQLGPPLSVSLILVKKSIFKIHGTSMFRTGENYERISNYAHMEIVVVLIVVKFVFGGHDS